MAAFALVESYLVPPGGCYLCKSSQRMLDGGLRERIVDSGLTVDFEGRLYVCETCVHEMAVMLGWTASRHQRLVDETYALRAELDREKARGDEFEGKYNDFLDVIAERLAAVGPPSAATAVAAPVLPVSPPSLAEAAESAPTVARTQPSGRPRSKRGRGAVR